MERKQLIQYWTDTAEQDFNTMIHLFNAKDYHWALFIGHLVLEKLLKALYVSRIDENIPKIHDLLRLAEKSKIELTEIQKDNLDTVTTFNISARYPDYKQTFYRKCTLEFTKQNIEKIKEIRLWILYLLKNE